MDQNDQRDVIGTASGEWSGDRPPPQIPSLMGGAGAIFLLLSLMLFLTEIDGDNRRLGGLVACLLFQAVGIGLMLLTQRRAATSAGVGLTALAVIPLMVFLFIDVKDPGNTIDSPSSFTSTATMMLLVAAALWLLAYFVGPGRRYGIYLAGALVAIWLVVVVQIVDNPIGQFYANFTQPEMRFESVGEAIGDSSFDDDYSDGSLFEDDYHDGTYQDDFDNTFQGDDYEDFPYEIDPVLPYQDVDDPTTKLGWASLLFGLVYLVAGAFRDKRGDQRMATPLIGVSAPLLAIGLAFLSRDLGDTGTAFAALAIGAAQMFVGSRSARRFTSWIGVLQAAGGVIALVDQAAGDSAITSAIVLLVLGVGTTVGALFLEGGLDVSKGSGGPAGPAGPGSGPGPSPWEVAPPVPQPTAPPPAEVTLAGTPPVPDGPPSTPPSDGPMMQAPPPPAWGSPTAPPAASDPTVWAPPPADPPSGSVPG